MNWRWIDKRALLLLHAETLAEHGGSAGIRDEGLLDSALARPQNVEIYGTASVAALAAAYAFGLAKNHAFIDGNKRAAFLAAGLFLALNGYRLSATQVEATSAMLALAAGELDEKTFARWVHAHAKRR